MSRSPTPPIECDAAAPSMLPVANGARSRSEGFRPVTPKRFEIPGERLSPTDYWAYFKLMRHNPLSTWSARSYQEPVLDINFLGRQVVVLNDPLAIQQCYVANAGNYRLNYIRQAIIGPVTRNGLISAEGADWTRMRRLLTPVFNARRVAALAAPMAGVARRAAVAIADKDGETISAADAMVGMTLDILMATLFSDDHALDRVRFSETVGALMEKGGRPHAFDLLRLSPLVPRVGNAPVLRIVDDLRRQIDSLIEHRRAQAPSRAGSDATNDDLLTLLLTAGVADGEPLSNDEIVDNLITLLVAGHETTARGLAWTLYLLSQDETVRARIEAEVDAVDLAALPPESWEGALPLTNAVLKEAMRLYPPAPHIAREAIGEDTINGPDGPIRIHPGTDVHVSPWLLHRHETLWSEPGLFRPDRFLGDGGRMIPRFAYLPFGLGPRVCIGARFAQQEMIIALASLVKSVRFDHVGDTPPEPVMRVTLHPSTPIPMQVSRR